MSQLPDPKIQSITHPWSIAVTGVGETGILTIGGVLGIAAHLEDKIPSHGGADLLLAADGVVVSSREGLSLCDAAKTNAVLNTKVTPVSNFVRERDFDFKQSSVEEVIASSVANQEHFYDFSTIAL